MELDFSEKIKAKWDGGMKRDNCAQMTKDGKSCAQMPHNKQEEMLEPKKHNEKVENEAAKMPQNAQEEKSEPKNLNEKMENEAGKMPHNKQEEALEPKNHDEKAENEASQQKFGDKKRSDLKDSDFLFPADRSFPIVSPQDVKDAISNFGRMKGNMSYDEFLKKLHAFCQRKGPEFLAALPSASKEKLGMKG